MKLDKSKYEKQLITLGQEIATCYTTLEIIKELFKQFKENDEIFQKYSLFLYSTYFAFHDQLIFNINRLHDESRDSLSLLKLLKKNLQQYGDNNSEEETKILKTIKNNIVYEKSKKLRNKYGKAHLDRKVSINEEKRKKIYEENKIKHQEYYNYIKLLEKAKNILYRRLGIICLEMTIQDHTPQQIKKLFKVLAISFEHYKTSNTDKTYWQ